MAISFLGSAENSAANGGDVTLDLTGITGLAGGDLVIVGYAIGHDNNTGRDLTINTPTDYIEVADLLVGDTQDCELGVFYKVQGASPDASVVVEGHGGMDDAVVAVAMAFRGVDTTTPMDVTATTANNSDQSNPDPPSISPATAGAWVVIVGATAHVFGGAGTYTFPTGYTTDAIDRSADDADDVSIGMGYNSSPASPTESPGLMLHSGGTAATDSWLAVTLALRPAADGGGGGGSILPWITHQSSQMVH